MSDSNTTPETKISVESIKSVEPVEPVEPAIEKKFTLLEEINNLEKAYAENVGKSIDLQKKQLESLQQLMPKQITYLKTIIGHLQNENKDLKEKLSSRANNIATQ